MIWPYLGVALTLTVFGYLAVGLIGTLRRVQIDGQRQTFERERFQEELKSIRERRRLVADAPQPWNGFRKFVVKRKVLESSDVCSFHLAPHDAKPLPDFKPGQYLTFQLPQTQPGAPLIRCYSLSDRASPAAYRVSIKRVPPPRDVRDALPGLGSGIFHDHINEGDILDVRAPGGHFFLDLSETRPVVLIGGGIGITPVFSMLASLVHAQSRREVWLFYGVRNRREHIFARELAAFERDHSSVRVRVCYSQPDPDDRSGTDYHLEGRVTVDLLKKQLPSNNFVFYYCGPGPMMESLTGELKEWGVPEADLHFEAFGPSSVKKVKSGAASGGTMPPMAMAKCSVTFRKSERKVPWTEASGSLLELAENAGVVIASGCRAGNCGTCVVAMQSGEVSYLQPPGSPPEARTCLACIAQPKGDLVIDA